eukprot:scaffold3990_cov145-Skeletonema_marinoi.AAC.1
MRRRAIYATTIVHCHRPSCICICRQSDRADSEINLRNCTAITHITHLLPPRKQTAALSFWPPHLRRDLCIKTSQRAD